MAEQVSEHPLIDHKYGIRSPVKIPDLELELYAFRNRLQPNEGGLGTFDHFRNATKMLWPKMSWNPWLEAQVEGLCEHDYVGWAGCGASGKTFGATLFATVWWLANPSKTTVVLTSTTAKMIRKRMWANLQDLVRKSRGFPGNMVDSKMSLQAIKGDDRHSISAIAVAEGNTSKAVANIQGIHAERVMVIIDEATDTPEAAFEACTNLSKGCREFKMLVIGNPASKFDPHGRFCTPAKGWRSVTIEDQHWLTERGMCRRFDGMKSPNISEGRTKYPYLITQDQVLSAMRHEGEQSPTFWKYTRGFWSPDGMVKTVLSESLIETHTPTKNLVFTTNVQVVAGLDPGFGGDRCVLRFAKVGTANDKLSILFQDIIQKITRHEKSEESREFAGRMQAALFTLAARSLPGARNRGVKKAPFVVLVGAQMPSILCEIGFLSNPREETLLKRADHRQKLAEALYRGLSRYAEGLSHFQMARSK
jgi:N-acetylmuramoyl-L-alanine amidase